LYRLPLTGFSISALRLPVKQANANRKIVNVRSIFILRSFSRCITSLPEHTFEIDRVLTIPAFAQSNMRVAHDAEYAMSGLHSISQFLRFMVLFRSGERLSHSFSATFAGLISAILDQAAGFAA
jgi:hypothetical protein